MGFSKINDNTTSRKELPTSVNGGGSGGGGGGGNDNDDNDNSNTNLENTYMLNSNDHHPKTHLDSDPTNNKQHQQHQPLYKEVRTQFRQFCETTSLRGVPRIMHAKDTKHRLLWLIMVLALFVGCITCLTLIVTQYLEFDVIHQPKKLYDQPRPFPSVTLCNLRPFSTRDIRKLKKAGVQPVDMYFDLFKKLMVYVNMENRRYLTMLWNLASYISNLPDTVDVTNLGHSLEDIVKRCYILYKTGSMTRGTACEKAGYWTKTQDRVFHNCYTYTVNFSRTNAVLNMELVLYLDNLVEQTDCFDCQERVMASQLTGARLLLHPGASFPRVAEEGINLMPGTMTDIRFFVNEWSMMEPPHGRCSGTTPEFISFNNVNYTYSEEACRYRMVQRKIAQECHCVSRDLPVPTELLGLGLRNCQEFLLPATYASTEDLNRTYQTYFNNQIVSNYSLYAGCAERVGTEMETDQTGCRPACIRYTYKPSITAAQWPTKTFLTWFVTKFLKEMEATEAYRTSNTDNATIERAKTRLEELRNALQAYDQIANLTKSGHQQEAIKQLMQVQTFEQNFLSIIVSRPNFDLERLEEKAVVSLASLFSQIGGLLSIWIGLTFICIIEVIELSLNVVELIVKCRKKKH